MIIAAAGFAEQEFSGASSFVGIVLLLLASLSIAYLAYVGLQALLEIAVCRSQISLKQTLAYMFAVAIATALYFAVRPMSSDRGFQQRQDSHPAANPGAGGEDVRIGGFRHEVIQPFQSLSGERTR